MYVGLEAVYPVHQEHAVGALQSCVAAQHSATAGVHHLEASKPDADVATNHVSHSSIMSKAATLEYSAQG